MCDLTNLAEIRNKLRTAYYLKINGLLFQLLGPETLNIAKEEQLLHQIRLVAVKGLHKEVHRRTFHNIRQQEGKGITHYLAKLQSLSSGKAAAVCKALRNWFCTYGVPEGILSDGEPPFDSQG